MSYLYRVSRHGRRKGGREGAVPQAINQRGTAHQNRGYFSISFLQTYYNFAFSNIFAIKWPKSEEILNLG